MSGTASTGMTPEEAGKIFDRFYKGPTSHGSGLGLAIARNLVAAHGGEIRCESRPGAGTTFTITLPNVRSTQGESWWNREGSKKEPDKARD